MIQRIQTLYLLVAISMLSIIAFTGDFFTIITNAEIKHYNSVGISSYTLDGKHLINEQNLPLYIIPIVLALFAFVVLLSYKQLNRQFRLSKILWGLYLLLVVGVAVWYFIVKNQEITGEVIGGGYDRNFYLLVIGLPFTHLAYAGIRKDKKTIDSLNRLR
jgi:amino acid transporter